MHVYLGYPVTPRDVHAVVFHRDGDRGRALVQLVRAHLWLEHLQGQVKGQVRVKVKFRSIVSCLDVAKGS